MGRFAPKDESAASAPPTVAEISAQMPVGSRCEVVAENGVTKYRGTIRFAGETDFGTKTGVWVGVEYDEAYGKNDGSWVSSHRSCYVDFSFVPYSVEGKKYFTCPPSKGAFVRPKRVAIGDFPPEELNLDDDEEI